MQYGRLVAEKSTRQRRLLTDLISARGHAFTAEDLWAAARETGSPVSLATVYRTLSLLESSELVRRLDHGRFIACEPGHHHHLVCVSCGAVEETSSVCPLARGGPEAARVRRPAPRRRPLRDLPSLRVSWIAVPLSLFTVLSTLLGGLTALRLRRHLEPILALSGGIVVAVALFDVLPEAISGINDPRRVTTLVAGGFLVFFFFQRMLVLHHRDDPEEARAHRRVGAFGAGALSLHSFIDGLGIGLAFGVNTVTGLLVFTAVVSHDFADGLNTVTFVLRQRGERRQALKWLASTRSRLFGRDRGHRRRRLRAGLAYLLAVYSGFFLYLGASDLLRPPARVRRYGALLSSSRAFGLTYAIVALATQ